MLVLVLRVKVCWCWCLLSNYVGVYYLKPKYVGVGVLCQSMLVLAFSVKVC